MNNQKTYGESVDLVEIQKINCQLNSLISNRSQSISFSNTNKESLGKIIKNIISKMIISLNIMYFILYSNNGILI